MEHLSKYRKNLKSDNVVILSMGKRGADANSPAKPRKRRATKKVAAKVNAEEAGESQ